MTSYSSLVVSSRLPEYCTPTNSFLLNISLAFNTCIPTPLAFFSTSLGILSIGAWLFALPPQIYKNYVLKSASGLSVFFLIEWFFGDLTNMLGALFTGQASWQVVLAAYYVSVDLIMAAQYIWYSYIQSSRKGRVEEDKLRDDERDFDRPGEVLIGVSPTESIETEEDTHNTRPKSITSTKSAKDVEPTTQHRHSRKQNSYNLYITEKLTSRPKTTWVQASPLPAGASPRTLLFLSALFALLANASPTHPFTTTTTSQFSNKVEFAGRLLSWTSSLLYLVSRLPQIFKNHTRRSTSGLSPGLFAAAFTGNALYSTSVVMNPLAWASCPPHGLHGWAGAEGNDRWTWVVLAAPFWLGTAGVLALDATIGMQFLRFGAGTKISVETETETGGRRRGRWKWRGVKGWMRGWVPSPGPLGKGEGNGEGESDGNGNSNSNNDERPLLAGDEEGRGRYV